MSQVLQNLALPSEGLSLLRKGLGVLCILDSLQRLTSSTMLLSDFGVFPRALYYTLFDSNWMWSFYLISGRPEFAITLLVLTIGLASLHLAGRSSKGTRLCLWLLVSSVQVRNPGLVDSADTLLRLMLFWDIFLPEKKSEKTMIFSPATLGLQAQLTLALLLTGLSFDTTHYALAAQWGDCSRAALVPWFSTVARVMYGLLIVAVWWHPIRRFLLVAAAVVLLCQSLLLQPVWPVTLAVALLPLAAFRPHQDAPVSGSRKAYLAAGCLTALALTLNLSDARPVKRWGEALCLSQDWSRMYPRASDSLYEVVVKSPGGTVWVITRDSDRRLRNYAQKIGENHLWAYNLSRAVSYELALKEPLKVFLSLTEVKPDYSFGEFKVVEL